MDETINLDEIALHSNERSGNTYWGYSQEHIPRLTSETLNTPTCYLFYTARSRTFSCVIETDESLATNLNACQLIYHLMDRHYQDRPELQQHSIDGSQRFDRFVRGATTYEDAVIEANRIGKVFRELYHEM